MTMKQRMEARKQLNNFSHIYEVVSNLGSIFTALLSLVFVPQQKTVQQSREVKRRKASPHRLEF